MPDTTLGITYPDAAAHTRIWEHMQALAEDVDGLLAAIPKVAGGLVTASGSSNGQAFVTFPSGRFTDIPAVALGVVNYPGNNIAYSVDQITTSGCRVNAYNITSGSSSGVAVSAYWVAVQEVE